MYAVLIVLVAFGMLNTMLMSVLERTHEFGILLAGFNLPAGPDGSEFGGLSIYECCRRSYTWVVERPVRAPRLVFLKTRR